MSRYDPSTALVVVDIQNDFADPDGSLYVPGGEAIVPLVNDQVEAALAAGGRVVYTQDWHPPSTPHFQKDGGIWPVHCVAGTWGARSHPGLRVEGPVVRKGIAGEDGYSGFSVRDPLTGETDATELERILRDAGIRGLVVVGLATDYCVRATALDARSRHFPTALLAAAVRAVDLAEGDGDRALAELREAGVHVDESDPPAETGRRSERPASPGTAEGGAAPSAEH